jgi:hypothetical protein
MGSLMVVLCAILLGAALAFLDPWQCCKPGDEVVEAWDAVSQEYFCHAKYYECGLAVPTDRLKRLDELKRLANRLTDTYMLELQAGEHPEFGLAWRRRMLAWERYRKAIDNQGNQPSKPNQLPRGS